MKIYLDIDNTLLYSEGFDSKPVNYLKEFLENVTSKHDVYWLTTHCNGDASVPVDYMSRFVGEDLVQLIKIIKPTMWNISKSEAIDMSKDFLWFDDILMFSDEKRLREANRLDCFVRVNIASNPDFLKGFLTI